MTYNTNCKSCKAILTDKFCSHCGEKVVEKNDFSMKTLMNQFVDGVFNFDAKIYKTFINLIFKPGRLTTHYIEGFRKPFMKPIQVFLISNILFFLLLSHADVLRIPSQYYFNGERNLNTEILKNNSKYSEVAFKQRYDELSSNTSKALVIVIVPLLALVLWLLYYKTDFLFGMHLIFGIHFISFFFLICLLALAVHKFGNKIVQIFIIGTNYFYLYFAMKYVYKDSKLKTILKSFLLLFSFIIFTLLYREAVSYLSYKLV